MMLLAVALVLVFVVVAAMRLRDGGGLDRLGRCVSSSTVCGDH
jgi:hypothetical protein